MGENTDLKFELRDLLDKQAIHEIVLKIARGTDRFDRALLSMYIHPEAVIDLGGPSPLNGAAFIAALAPPADPRPGRMHVIANVLVELHSDRAFAESYLLSYQEVTRQTEHFTRVRCGRYLDRFHRETSGWKLTHRTLVDEAGRVDRLLEAVPHGKYLGTCAPGDMLYTMLAAAPFGNHEQAGTAP
jgi:hypothetical protein